MHFALLMTLSGMALSGVAIISLSTFAELSIRLAMSESSLSAAGNLIGVLDGPGVDFPGRAPGAFHQAEAVTMGDKDHEAFVIRRSLASIVSENAYSVDGIVAAVSPS